MYEYCQNYNVAEIMCFGHSYHCVGNFSIIFSNDLLKVSICTIFLKIVKIWLSLHYLYVPIYIYIYVQLYILGMSELFIP